jgi:translation initiation factor 3 subunit K
LNPDRIRDEFVTNILVKAMTQFPSAQFDLAMHLLSPQIAMPPPAPKAAPSDGPAPARPNAELAEAVAKLRALNGQLESAQYARFWATMDSDDLYADLTTDIAGFEDMVRVRIAQLVGQACREISGSVLEAWLGMDTDKMRRFVVETGGWKVDEATGNVLIPKNPDNEAKKTEIREDVNFDMFARVIRRSWEESV